MIQEDRALWKYIVFGFLTCGIYNFYFIYKMAQDVNEMCADDGKKTSGLVVFILLSYLTCGIYTLIWYYSLANRLAENAPRYGLQFQETGRRHTAAQKPAAGDERTKLSADSTKVI